MVGLATANKFSIKKNKQVPIMSKRGILNNKCVNLRIKTVVHNSFDGTKMI